jgi:drug/metabolite transporter (DMT)-like permease
MSAPARLDDATATQSGPPPLTWRSTAVLVCVLYTMLTVTSSSLALLRGIETDTHLHLLARFAITLVGVGFISMYGLLYRRLQRAPAVTAALATYAAAMATVLAVTWAFGRIEPLHPEAYRDITLNFTTIYIGVAVVLLAIAGWRRRQAS